MQPPRVVAGNEPRSDHWAVDLHNAVSAERIEDGGEIRESNHADSALREFTPVNQTEQARGPITAPGRNEDASPALDDLFEAGQPILVSACEISVLLVKVRGFDNGMPPTANDL